MTQEQEPEIIIDVACHSLFDEIMGSLEALRTKLSPEDQRAAEELLLRANTRAIELMEQNGYGELVEKMQADNRSYYNTLMLRVGAARLLDAMDAKGNALSEKEAIEKIAEGELPNQPNFDDYFHAVPHPFNIVIGALFSVDVTVNRTRYKKIRDITSVLLGQKRRKDESIQE